MPSRSVRVPFLTILAALCLTLPSVARAGLSRQDGKAIKKMLEGTLYLRIDAPSKVGFTGFGLSFDPIVEVSPAGANVDSDSFSFYGMGTSWNVVINDAVKLDEIDIDADDGEIDVELDTLADDSDHTVIKFVHIGSLADFQAAFERAFARVPLQDEHPEWPDTVRRAIASRTLTLGMNKRQAYYIVGKPQHVEESTAAGKEVVVWTLRTASAEVGRMRHDSGLPHALRFEDGALVEIEGQAPVDELKLDN
jgi:hypothetical protein